MPDDKTPLSELDRERLDAFKSGMTRCRWFLLTVLLIACFMLLHLFTGELGYQTLQTQQFLKSRLLKVPDANLQAALDKDNRTAFSPTSDELAIVQLLRRNHGNKLRKDVTRYLADKDNAAARDQDADLVANGVYKALTWERELGEVRVREGAVPLLGVTVPGNDYIVVMTWLLLIFSTALWLSLRSIEGVADTIESESPLKRFLQLHVTFTGLMKESRGTAISRGIQYSALWLPCALFLITCAFDIYPAARDAMQSPGYVVLGRPSYVVLRLFLFIGASAWIIALAVSNSGRMLRLDRWLYAN